MQKFLTARNLVVVLLLILAGGGLWYLRSRDADTTGDTIASAPSPSPSVAPAEPDGPARSLGVPGTQPSPASEAAPAAQPTVTPAPTPTPEKSLGEKIASIFSSGDGKAGAATAQAIGKRLQNFPWSQKAIAEAANITVPVAAPQGYEIVLVCRTYLCLVKRGQNPPLVYVAEFDNKTGEFKKPFTQGYPFQGGWLDGYENNFEQKYGQFARTAQVPSGGMAPAPIPFPTTAAQVQQGQQHPQRSQISVPSNLTPISAICYRDGAGKVYVFGSGGEAIPVTLMTQASKCNMSLEQRQDGFYLERAGVQQEPQSRKGKKDQY